MLMVPLYAWVLPAVFLLCGALIWFGFYRSWTDNPHPTCYVTPFWPWAAVVFSTILFTSVLGINKAPHDMLLDVLWVIGTALGIGAGLFRYPRWAVPPWYWKLKELDERYERGEISAMEHWRESRSPLDKLLRRR